MYHLNSTGIEEQQKPPPNSQTRPPDLLAVALWLSLGSSWSLQNREQSLAQSVSWQMWVVLGCQIKIRLEMQPWRRKPPSVPSTAPANQVSRLISCSGQVLGESFLTHRLQRWCYLTHAVVLGVRQKTLRHSARCAAQPGPSASRAAGACSYSISRFRLCVQSTLTAVPRHQLPSAANNIELRSTVN